MAVQKNNINTAPAAKAPNLAGAVIKLGVLTKEGTPTDREVALVPEVFAKKNDHVLTMAVIYSNNKKRQGTAKTKEKSEINASTRKLFRQKGTGNARRGSKKSGLLRGGGRCFGPKVRTYQSKMNKKEQKLARLAAWGEKSRNQQIVIVEDFNFAAPSTKAYLTVRNALLTSLQVQKEKMAKEKLLWVLPDPQQSKSLILSSNNVQRTKMTTAYQANVYDLLDATKVLVFESALPLLEKIIA